mgnify:FL=1
MIITKLFKDTYQIKMPNQIIDIYNQVKVKELTKEIIKKINKKNKLYGLTYLEIYQDINYGTIIKVKNDKTIYYKKDEIEIKIIIHTDIPLLYKIDYFDIKKDYKNKIYYYKNNFYLELENKINKDKYLKLLEVSEVIYEDTHQIINNGLKIKV